MGHKALVRRCNRFAVTSLPILSGISLFPCGVPSLFANLIHPHDNQSTVAFRE